MSTNKMQRVLSQEPDAVSAIRADRRVFLRESEGESSEILQICNANCKLNITHPIVVNEDKRGLRTLILSSLNYLAFNNAYIFDVEPEARNDQFERDVDFLETAAKEIQRLGVATLLTVGGGARAAELRPTIKRCGFVALPDSTIMHVDLDSMPVLTSFVAPVNGAPCIVREVPDLERFDQLQEAVSMALDAHGRKGTFDEQFADVLRRIPHGPGNPTRHFVALGSTDGRAVGVATLLLRGDMAYVVNIAVRHDARCKGIGRTLTLFAFKTAHDAGYKHAGLIASVEGKSLYESLGMRNIGTAAKFAMFP